MEPEQPTGPKKGRITGERLGTRGIVARAMLQQGDSLRKVREKTGISTTTASALRRLQREVIPNAREVEQVRKNLQGKLALTADAALDAIDDAKLREASAGELARVAALCADRAGLSAPSVMEHYHAVMLKFSSDPLPITSPTTE